MVKNYYLNSVFGFILNFLLLSACISITVLFSIYYEDVGIFALLISIMFILFCLFGIVVSFMNKIKVNFKNNQLTISSVRKTIKFENLKQISVSTEHGHDERKYCKIVFELNDGDKHEINGFNSPIKYKDVEKTRKLVEQINTELKLNVNLHL